MRATGAWMRGATVLLLSTALAAPSLARVQDSIDDATLSDRPIARVVFAGLERVPEREVLNNIRVAAGQPFDARAVRSDVATLYRLGQFGTIEAKATVLPDGTVEVVFTFAEQPIVKDIQVVGNKLISDQDLRKAIPLYAGGPRDDFLLEQAVTRIKQLYRERGHYLAEVTADESRLKDTGILILRIVEGPRVKVKEIEFTGNEQLRDGELGGEIRTRKAVPLFAKGELDEEVLIDDVAALDKYYKERGFVDVRVDRRVEISADSREAKVVFVISEGPRYRLRSVVVEGLGAEGPKPLGVFTPEQINDLLYIHPGDIYSRLKIDKSIASVRDSYLLLGHIDVSITDRTVRVGPQAEVDLLLEIREGPRTVAGLVNIQGNFLTKDKVVRRLVRMQPGRVLDGRELQRSEDRVRATRLFNDVRITVQRPRPEDQDALDTEPAPAPAGEESPDPIAAARTAIVRSEVRDILVEVKESNTGSVNFGVGLGTDSGVFGEFSVNQRNFDIADTPESIDELLAARAFRGAGQQFSMAIAPGNEVSTLSFDLLEPHLFETDYSLRGSPSYRVRLYPDYDETRATLPLTLSRRLGDFWTIGATVSYSWVELSNFEPDTALEVYEDRGPNTYLATGFFVKRADVDRMMRPSRGSNTEFSATQYTGLDGQEPFTVLRAGYTQFLTVSEDLVGNRTTLKIGNDLAYIIGDDVPTYERLYLGGRNFRGFEYRTISPKSQAALDPTLPAPNDPIGGNWLFFAGAQLEHPFVKDSLSGVVFVDSGTVSDEVTLNDYRLSVGFGIRLYIPAFGPAPLAFDFGIPILKEDSDETQVFSFSAEIPF
jgi:outer membrane protein insertion porin family